LPEGRIEIRISDHGPWHRSEQAGRLFQAFSKSKTDAVPGIGLGLFVSRQLRGIWAASWNIVPVSREPFHFNIAGLIETRRSTLFAGLPLSAS